MNKDSECQPKHWSSIILYDGLKHRQIWSIDGDFVSDQMVGLVSACLMMLAQNDLSTQYYPIVVEKNTNRRLIIGNLQSVNKLDNMGGYIGGLYVHTKQTNNTSWYKPDEGTTGIWILDREYPYNSYWDLLQLDDLDEFIKGFETMCIKFGVNYRDYILDYPIDSEGQIDYDYFDRLAKK